MAGNTSGGLTYFLAISAQHRSFIMAIRHWENLKIAFEEDTIWLKDLNAVQIDSVEVKAMPFRELYYSQGEHLFRAGGLLPDRIVPNVLWSPIQRGLPVYLPASLPNVLPGKKQITIRSTATDEFQSPEALMVDLQTLAAYIQSAPAVRLTHLSWIIMEPGNALMLGSPILPLPGKTFVRTGNFLFPTGRNSEFSLIDSIVQQELDASGNYLILWLEESGYYKISKNDFRELSIYSFRKTVRS